MITQEQLKDCAERRDALRRYLDIDNRRIELEEEELRTHVPDFWEHPKEAQAQMKKIKDIQGWITGFEEVDKAVEELTLGFDFIKEGLIEEPELDALAADALSKIERLELRNMLRREEDRMDVVLKINSGAGGTESQDWAEQLMRMYMRWAEKHGYKTSVANLLEGDEAGIKSATINIEGPYAYGYLKSENGVHRLVRVSPFDANARRQTSFAALEVMPELDDDSEIEIRPEDIEMQACRSSGAGGQHINKTSSAVRLIHKPTGIVTTCQTQRSQLQNREYAMEMMKAKLYQIALQQHKDKIDDIKGVQNEIAWGHQIRSYVFMPYTMVKDHRTNYETGNVDAVMDGDLDGFIFAYLKAASRGELKED